MKSSTFRRVLAAAGGLALPAAAIIATGSPAAAAATTATSRTLPPGTVFTPRPADAGATQQIAQLRASGDTTDASRLQKVVNTPQAFWLTGGDPSDVQQQVSGIVANDNGTVPTLVLYDVPGRDCGSYSAGGAGTDAAYQAWVDGVDAGLGQATAVVLVEPDGLSKLPSDCGSAYPGQDVAALTQARINDISYAAAQTESRDPNALVYLDAGNSDNQSVGTMASRLAQAGVADVQGFFLNASNYQYANNSDYYGTWISDCLAYATGDNSTGTPVSDGNFGNCGDQYWSGGPANNWTGSTLSPYGKWTPTASNADLNTSGVTSRFASELGSVQPESQFVVDTSRSGDGPNSMTGYESAPYDQSPSTATDLQAGGWCNSPGAGTGPLPRIAPSPSAFPLLAAYLWVKTVGESDGQCNIAGQARTWDYSAYNPWGWDTTEQQTNDPLWGVQDPAAGTWFPQQALQLAKNATQLPS